jgi:hypothetical protein
MMRKVLGLAFGLMITLAAGPAISQEAIGAVDRLQGSASGGSEPLAVGSPVFLNQEVTTGEAARLELTFDDGTQLTLGEKAKMVLDTFVYSPAQGTGTMKLAVVGAFRFVSGQVSKQPLAQVAVTTPVAVVGVRGTEFWGGPIDNEALGVFLIEGEVSVTNPAGEQILDTPGQGTNISTPDSAPGEVTIWPQDKVERALATVAFQ